MLRESYLIKATFSEKTTYMMYQNIMCEQSLGKKLYVLQNVSNAIFRMDLFLFNYTVGEGTNNQCNTTREHIGKYVE